MHVELIKFEEKEIQNASGKTVFLIAFNIQGQKCCDFVVIASEIGGENESEKIILTSKCFICSGISPFTKDVSKVEFVDGEHIDVRLGCKLIIKIEPANPNSILNFNESSTLTYKIE